MPPIKMHYETGELGHTDFRMMARRLSHFAPGGRLVMLPRAEFEALQSRAEGAERTVARLVECSWCGHFASQPYLGEDPVEPDDKPLPEVIKEIRAIWSRDEGDVNA